MNAIAHVLIVEDEEQLQRMLSATLTQAGYSVTAVKSGMGALEQLIRTEFSVILLDLGLPDMDGKDVIAQARAVSKAAVLVISARDSGTEKVAALDLGANDYISKPFDTNELLARIRVALRPARCGDAPSETASGRHRFELESASRRAIIAGQAVRLSRKETEFLQLLMDAEGHVVTHDTIISTIWGKGSDADFMNVRVLAWQVRRKIEQDAAAPRYLIAEAGEGYRLNRD